jgi:transcriptional regulator with XRE-family HTH domain
MANPHKTKKKTTKKKPTAPGGCPPAGELVAKARKAAGLTQLELSVLYDVGQNRESAIERSVNLQFDTMYKILRCTRSEKAPFGFELVLRKRKAADEVAT